MENTKFSSKLTMTNWTRNLVGAGLAVSITACGGGGASSSAENNSTSLAATVVTAPAAATWTKCALEGAVCSFSGTKQVRYGLNGTYFYKTATTSIQCTNAIFGDPLVGANKVCEYSIDSTTAPTKRDPLQQPFSSNSIWNKPIGTGAVFAPANLLAAPRNAMYAALSNPDPERIVMTPTAPLTTFNYSSAGWSGANRCAATGGANYGLPVQVPMPSDYIVPNDNNNSGAAFLAADGRTVVQMQPIARCSAGGPGTALVAPAAWRVDLYGDGILGAHGGSGLSTLGGTIRLGELRPGQQGMNHALKLDVDGGSELYHASTRADSYRWPAVTSDSYWARYGTVSGGQNNNNPAMKIGSLLAIPSATSIESLGLETVPGRQMAWTLQNYGAYIVDTYDSANGGFAVEEGPKGKFVAQFQADYGYSLLARNGDKTPWARDVAKLRQALRVVNNNTATSVGGGGTPLQPLASPLQ